MFIWGSAADGKLGLGKDAHGTVNEPLYADWHIEKTGFYTETGQPAVR